MKLNWRVYNDDNNVESVAAAGDVIDSSKYSVSKNPSTGLYYRLHILNVKVSDLKMYRCHGVNQDFYIQLDLLGRCNTMVIFNVVNHRLYACWK